MKQPDNKLTVFDDTDDEFGLNLMWIDICCGQDEGGMCTTGIGHGRTEQAAWKAAVRRLKKLLKQAESKIKEN